TDGNLLEVRAPYDGTVTNLGPRRAGVVIERGDVLCQLARTDVPLRAEVTVADKDSGRLVVGQPLKLLFESFPYPRYGTREGALTWVSAAAESGKFRAFASLRDATVVVDRKNVPLRAGMGGEARIVTGTRTLAEFAIEPLRKIRETVTLPRP